MTGADAEPPPGAGPEPLTDADVEPSPGAGPEPPPTVIALGNEFAHVVVRKVRTRNGERLLISAPKRGREILLCPMELESLTWQTAETFSRFLADPFGPDEIAPADRDPAKGEDPGANPLDGTGG